MVIVRPAGMNQNRAGLVRFMVVMQSRTVVMFFKTLLVVFGAQVLDKPHLYAGKHGRDNELTRQILNVAKTVHDPQSQEQD